MTEHPTHSRQTGKASPRMKGEKLAPLKERLARIGLVSSWDYVLHLPLRYEDETAIMPIGRLAEGRAAQVEGRVVSQRVTPRSLTAVVEDGTGRLQVTLLHYYSSRQLAEGSEVRLYGEPKRAWSGPCALEMVHPRIHPALKAGEALPRALTPVYPAGEGIAQRWIRSRIDRALLDLDLSDLLPEAIRKPLALPSLKDALQFLHHPPAGTRLDELDRSTAPAWRRLKLDELLAQQISLRLARSARQGLKAPALPPRREGSLCERLIASLPFELTQAQSRVWQEIAGDLAQSRPMNRLVQGDVGSGKTVIAALAACRAIEAGRQAALMAPTEILAEQHCLGLSRWLKPLGVPIVWLAGRMKAAEKKRAAESIASGEARLVIGTHALIQEGVRFKELGLAIIDEQHRFGVAQRQALRASGDGVLPHLLMLSATPIPRTLAMSYLADFDVSVIDELPPGRTPVTTKVLSIARKAELIRALGKSLSEGRQAYWVCPLIEESEGLDLASARQTFEAVSAALPQARTALMHGLLPPEEKEAVMRRFAAGEVDLLVATTVIEVGVDVPNATLMVIEHAERFGLAQLHQLRGRVGRGSGKSWCFLLYGEPLSESGRERLKVIRSSSDGFEIARKDLELRGPGEFLGARQSGLPMLRFADLETDQALLEKARAAAIWWLQHDPEQARRHARRWFPQAGEFLSA